jgi:DNA-binding MarR family transcriptional regulator
LATGNIEDLLTALSRQLSAITFAFAELAQRLDVPLDSANIDRLVQQLQSPFLLSGEGQEVQVIQRSTKPPLPEARLVRQIIRNRQLRAKHLDADLFGEPAWDMLLDLAAAQVEFQRVSVTSLCIASGVPATTALRWIGQLVDVGLFKRVEDQTDRRRAFIELTDKATAALTKYFAEVGNDRRTFY